MQGKIQVGKWYQLCNTQPSQDTQQITSCMKVAGGVLIRNVTFLGGSKFDKFSPEKSSESMAFVPNVILEVGEGNNCVIREGLNG